MLLDSLLSSFGIGFDIDPLTGIEVDSGLVSTAVEPPGSTSVSLIGSEVVDVDLSSGVAVSTLGNEVEVDPSGVAVSTLGSEVDVSSEGVTVGVGDEVEVDLTEGVSIDLGDLIGFAFDISSDI